MLTAYTLETAPKESKELLQEAESAFGYIPNLIKVLSGSPGTLKAYNTLFEIFFHKTTLSMLEAQIVLMVSSIENNSAYDVAAHSWGLKLTQVPADVIDSLRNGQKLNDPRLEELKNFTKDLMISRGHLSKERMQQFLHAGFTESNMLDILTGLAAKLISNFSNSMAYTELDAPMEEHRWSR